MVQQTTFISAHAAEGCDILSRRHGRKRGFQIEREGDCNGYGVAVALVALMLMQATIAWRIRDCQMRISQIKRVFTDGANGAAGFRQLSLKTLLVFPWSLKC